MLVPSNAQLPVPASVVNIALTSTDHEIAHWIFWISSVIVAVGVIYALQDWRKNKSVVPLLLIIGGAAANLSEPFVDIVAGCWHPAAGQHTLFELMGRPMPVWLFPTYIASFGVQAMVMYVAFRRGISARAMWLWYLVPVMSDIVLEVCLLNLSDNLYVYYGNQPLVLAGFPLFWAPINALGVYVPVVVLTLLSPHMKGWKLATVPLFTPLLYAAVMGLTGMPSIVVINTAAPSWMVPLGGLASTALALTVVFLCVRMLADGSRYNLRQLLRPA